MAKLVDEENLATLTATELEKLVAHHNRLYWERDQPEIDPRLCTGRWPDAGL